MLLPHIGALASHAPPDTDTDTEAIAYLLNQAGLFLDDQGQPSRAAGYLQHALADWVRLLGASPGKIYARCIDGQADAANQRITEALGIQDTQPESESDNEGDDDSEQAS
jgi:hypothetical protein